MQLNSYFITYITKDIKMILKCNNFQALYNICYIKGSFCLLSFSAASFVFQLAIQKYKDLDIQNYNFSCCFVWVLSLVAHTVGGR